ncbi:hypothetical protein Agub_g13406 [Astrephomene gubernaculifera]|uniref:Bulb-type lectin domain-containing protein n=1 Tax=Astrephomene gubernaculifera TaxID=47775 RepID=A0AAD3HSL5_9CHLO|nr:hypothetical protein Agub_g13406 [Astrephomene gubernaculifera]
MATVSSVQRHFGTSRLTWPVQPRSVFIVHVLVLLLNTSAKAQSAAGGDSPPVSVLIQGQALSQGQSLYSQSGAYRLDMQGNGNLVVYQTSTGTPTWSLQKYGAFPPAIDGPYIMTLKDDGNFAVLGASSGVVWATQLAYVGSGLYKAIVADDGNLNLVSGDGRTYWSSACAVFPGYKFLPFKDQYGSDELGQQPNLESALSACNADCRCKGFNSGAWVKTGCDKLVGDYTGTCNGLYVRDNPPTCSPPPSPSPSPPSPTPPGSTPLPSPVSPPSTQPSPSPRTSGPPLSLTDIIGIVTGGFGALATVLSMAAAFARWRRARGYEDSEGCKPDRKGTKDAQSSFV